MLTSLVCLALIIQTPSDPLANGFRNPPPSVRPHTWWHWMNGNVTREGITADLEAMKEVGIGGAQLFTVDQSIPAGPAGYMSPLWRELTTHAVREAGRLGIELCLHNCAGWSSSGGPWIKPEDAMQVLAWSETKVEGPKLFSDSLPQPQAPKVFKAIPYYRDVAVYAFRTPDRAPDRPSNFLERTGVTRGNGIQPEFGNDQGQSVTGVLNLSDRLSADGRLNWEVPAGRWTILRMGHVPTGKDNHPAPPEGNGLEVDKLSREAMDKHWDGMMAKVLADAGSLSGKVLNNALIDSYEVGGQNWTPKFREEFTKLRGYDPMPYLPVVAGFTVESKEKSERFLWDFRKTIADLFAKNYFGRFAELCRKAGLKFSVEPYGDGNFDNIQSGAIADIPMGEFWTAGWAMESIKLAASIGHVYGRPVIGAESFTADENSGRWLEEPYAMKVMGDRAFCEGVNRYIFHRYAHQPWMDVKPGMTMGPWGTHFERTQTWWTEAKEWLRYISRSQFLLQRGRFVADICYYYGEDAPADLPARGNLRPTLPRGYDYDGCDAGAVRLMSVRNGRLVLPSGMSYSLLVLPESKFMTPEIAKKVQSLVAAGATVVGPKPEHSPSLSGYPATDRETQRIAQELWGQGNAGVRQHGKGRIVNGLPLKEVLADLRVKPDFEFTPQSVGTNLISIHRKMDNSDVYFVSNQRYRPGSARCTFRVQNMIPELWHPDTGKTELVPAFQVSEGRTSFDLSLAPAESVFVVFRKPAPSTHFVSFGPKDAPSSTRLSRLIEIQSAFYGSADGIGADVSDKVRQMVSEEQIEIPATNGVFGDPVPNVVKKLIIMYKVRGVLKRVEAPENTDAILIELPSGEASSYTVKRRPDGALELTAWRPGAYAYKLSSGRAGVMTVSEAGRSIDLSSKWDVAFAPNLGAPAKAQFAKLLSWTDHKDSGIRYFSGSATYTKTFDVPESMLSGGRAVRLDLGTVKNFATVTINDRPVATLWKPPFMLDVKPFIRSGKNHVAIKITNLWPNRIIGDEQLPPEVEWRGKGLARWPDWLKTGKALISNDRPQTGRITFGTWSYFDKSSPLLPSGLIGPVRLQSAKPRVILAGK